MDILNAGFFPLEPHSIIYNSAAQTLDVVTLIQYHFKTTLPSTEDTIHKKSRGKKKSTFLCLNYIENQQILFYPSLPLEIIYTKNNINMLVEIYSKPSCKSQHKSQSEHQTLQDKTMQSFASFFELCSKMFPEKINNINKVLIQQGFSFSRGKCQCKSRRE